MDRIKNYVVPLIAGIALFLGISNSLGQGQETHSFNKGIITGAERMDLYLSLLRNKSVAIVANQTARVKEAHLVDTLLSLGINVVKAFSPEHGFRGKLDAGEHVSNYVDEKTGIPIISLYGGNYKPKSNDLDGVEIVVFDIQDVGVRYYTYISTLHYVMEACAENDLPLLLLDRPNPNGFFVDGPVMEDGFQSFVGLHPVPLVHGMTIAEYAKMINGQGWLSDGVQCKLIHILCENYTHKEYYKLPVNPSPNLPNMASIYLYPSLGLFEGTIVSVGRGTDKPFQMIGHPTLSSGDIEFKPISKPGAKEPPYKGEICKGHDLSDFGNRVMRNYGKLYLFWLKASYDNSKDRQGDFFNNYFNSLAGNATLKQQIIEGVSEEDIRKSWHEGLQVFKKVRRRYLLYPDFE